MLRLFVAISLDPGPKLLDALHDFRHTLSGSAIKWVEAEKLHITLRFLGDTPRKRLDEIGRALARCQTNIATDILVRGAGSFGPAAQARVIWLGIEPEAHLKTLATDINFSLSQMGFAFPGKAFSPHLSLGRIKRLDKAELLQDCIGHYAGKELHRQPFTGFGLYSSLLKPDGPVYTLEKHFPLKP